MSATSCACAAGGTNAGTTRVVAAKITACWIAGPMTRLKPNTERSRNADIWQRSSKPTPAEHPIKRPTNGLRAAVAQRSHSHRQSELIGVPAKSVRVHKLVVSFTTGTDPLFV